MLNGHTNTETNNLADTSFATQYKYVVLWLLITSSYLLTYFASAFMATSLSQSSAECHHQDVWSAGTTLQCASSSVTEHLSHNAICHLCKLATR